MGFAHLTSRCIYGDTSSLDGKWPNKASCETSMRFGPASPICYSRSVLNPLEMFSVVQSALAYLHFDNEVLLFKLFCCDVIDWESWFCESVKKRFMRSASLCRMTNFFCRSSAVHAVCSAPSVMPHRVCRVKPACRDEKKESLRIIFILV
jgi:hypothetical protein